MNPNNRRDKDNNNDNNGTAKAITAMPMAWMILVAAALLLLGLSLTMTYHPALAQQNMTEVEGNATIGATGEASQSEVMFHLEGVRKALENNDVLGAMRYLDVAMNLLRGNSSSSQGNVTSSTTG
jgi:hypothetical protein